MTRQARYTDSQSRRKPPQSGRQDDPKRRRCLLCSHNFMSEWAGERVCGRCKQTAAWQTGKSQ